jgi:hypothetical protein
MKRTKRTPTGERQLSGVGITSILRVKGFGRFERDRG